MELFTKVDIPASSIRIDYTSRIAFFGSCFADNIAAQFAAQKFNVLSNPFGTVYNPLSIEFQLRRIADGKSFDESDVFKDNRSDNLWHSYHAHSSLSAATREECIAKLNTANAQAREFLQQADAVFITLGTAFVYSLDGNIVANCHRQDPNLFERRMITVDEAAEAICGIVACLRTIAGRDQHIVFTVSPLRHLGDGAHGNNLSKSTLHLAIEKAIAGMQAPAGTVTYFPSFEIVMDELRDYRFYADDMVHLSATAEKYIFARMLEAYCDDSTREYIHKVEKFLKSANHKIADPCSEATKKFAKGILAQADELESQIKGLVLDEERRYFAKFAI
jgi:hypothetical protein